MPRMRVLYDETCPYCGELLSKKGFSDETFFFCETCCHFVPDDEVTKVPAEEIPLRNV